MTGLPTFKEETGGTSGLYAWNDTVLTINVDGLDPGVYNWTIIVSYETGVSNRDTIIVIVVAQSSQTGSSGSEAGTAEDVILLILGMITLSLSRRFSQKKS